MSNRTFEYIDYPSICSHCQQILRTIELTSQQGIFIDDLTLIQQELEAVLIAANQREEFLRNHTGQHLQLPDTSMSDWRRTPMNWPFRRRKRKRRRRQLLNRYTRKTQQQMECITTKNAYHIKQIYLLDQFWSKFTQYQLNFIEQIDRIEKLIEQNESLLANILTQQQIKHFIEQINQHFHYYTHPELQYSIVIQRNQQFYHLIQRLSTTQRYKRKYSPAISSNSVDTIQQYFQRDLPIFSSKQSELEYHVRECVQLERLACQRAKIACEDNEIDLQISNIDEKIFELIHSIDPYCSYAKTNMFLLNQHLNSSEINETTLNIDEQLQHLIQHRMQCEKQLEENHMRSNKFE